MPRVDPDVDKNLNGPYIRIRSEVQKKPLMLLRADMNASQKDLKAVDFRQADGSALP
jgi:hypothetical protein